MEDDFAYSDALAARLLRPERPRLDAARAAVAGIESAREAWEALASRGVIPLDWVEQPMRAFREADSTRIASHPLTVAACVTLASDPEGVATAESLAREALQRLRRWGAAPVAHVTWSIGRTRWLRVFQPLAGAYAGYALSAWYRAARIERTTRMPAYAERIAKGPKPEVFLADEALVRDLVDAQNWAEACRRGLTVLDAMRGRRPLDALGARFADLPDPFEPLLGLWASGYALDALDAATISLLATEPAAARRPLLNATR